MSDSLARSMRCGGGGAVVDERQLDVVQRGGAGQQVEGLEDEADLLVADAGQLVVVQLADQLAVEPVFALGGRVQAADQVHQRGLAGAGGAHDGDVLVVLDAHGDAAQRLHLLLGAHVVGAPEVLDDDDVAAGPGRRLRDVFGADAVQSHPNLFLCRSLLTARFVCKALGRLEYSPADFRRDRSSDYRRSASDGLAVSRLTSELFLRARSVL